MMKLYNYTMRVYVKDRRCKSGERILKTYTYCMTHDQWIKEEVRDLQSALYPADKYRFEVDNTGDSLPWI